MGDKVILVSLLVHSSSIPVSGDKNVFFQALGEQAFLLGGFMTCSEQTGGGLKPSRHLLFLKGLQFHGINAPKWHIWAWRVLNPVTGSIFQTRRKETRAKTF